MTQDQLKQLVAQHAVQYIQPYLAPDVIIGVGTGSTADLFIDALANYRTHFKGAVASSERSATRLQSHGIQVFDLNAVDTMPVYVDGADEIDPQLAMIKGGGGALTREKIVASVAQRFICIADGSKLVPTLGRFPLPVEVLPMALQAVRRQLLQMGFTTVQVRPDFITDNGNPILDAQGCMFAHPQEMETRINQIPGVVTCGLFALMSANVALLATADGIQQLQGK